MLVEVKRNNVQQVVWTVAERQFPAMTGDFRLIQWDHSMLSSLDRVEWTRDHFKRVFPVRGQEDENIYVC